MMLRQGLAINHIYTEGICMKTSYIACFAVFCLLGGASRLYAGDTNTYNAVFVDRQDVTTDVLNVQYTPDYLNQAARQSHVLYGWRGQAQITIPWKNIHRIDFFDNKKEFNAIVMLRDKKKYVKMRVEAKTTEYSGKNAFGGTFRIRAEHVRSIIFK
jgi:hypothetical protein